MLSSLTVHTDTPDLLFQPSEVENVRQGLLQYCWWFDSSFLQPVMSTLLGREEVEELRMFELNRSSSLGHILVDTCFLQPLINLSLLPGYTPMSIHLPHPPTKISIGISMGPKENHMLLPPPPQPRPPPEGLHERKYRCDLLFGNNSSSPPREGVSVDDVI